MSNWADAAQDEEYVHDAASNGSYEDEEETYEDTAALWANAKTEVTHERDAEGNSYVVTRKVRQYHVDRPATAADLRAKLKHFGKGMGDQAAMVSTEPPLALEMESVDQFERETRTEVKRMIHEVSNMDVKVNDEHLRLAREEDEKSKKNVVRPAAAGSTWGSVATKPSDNREQNASGIRVRNLSDDITQENLSRIFEGRGWTTKTVRIPRGDNNQTRGFAFVIFEESWMADAAIKEGRFHFKNVVLDVTRAETRV